MVVEVATMSGFTRTFAPSPASTGRCCRPQPSAARQRLVVRAATTLPSQYKTVSPVGDRVFVKVDIEEAATSGGILLPTSAQKKPTQGEVVGLGDAKSLKSGDKVVYSKYAGTEVALDDTDYVLLKEDDVVGVMPSASIRELLPLGDRILIEVADAEEQTAGGLLMSAAAAEKPTLGKVIKVGSGRVDEKTNEVVKPNVEVGSTVLYSKYSGTEFNGDENDDRSYIVVRESDIIASLA